jgi:uncharacterized protein YifN (PemK superfamily)
MTNDVLPPAKGPEPELKPRRVQPRIIAAPKHGQIYWCNFWPSISMDGRRNWVISNHLYTVAPSRLSPEKGCIPRVPHAEFNEVLKRVTAWLPRPFELDKYGR